MQVLIFYLLDNSQVLSALFKPYFVLKRTLVGSNGLLAIWCYAPSGHPI